MESNNVINPGLEYEDLNKAYQSAYLVAKMINEQVRNQLYEELKSLCIALGDSDNCIELDCFKPEETPFILFEPNNINAKYEHVRRIYWSNSLGWVVASYGPTKSKKTVYRKQCYSMVVFLRTEHLLALHKFIIDNYDRLSEIKRKRK